MAMQSGGPQPCKALVVLQVATLTLPELNLKSKKHPSFLAKRLR